MILNSKTIRVLTKYENGVTYTKDELILYNEQVFLAKTQVPPNTIPTDGAFYRNLSRIESLSNGGTVLEVLNELPAEGDTSKESNPITLGLAKDLIRSEIGGLVGQNTFEVYTTADIDTITTPGYYLVDNTFPSNVEVDASNPEVQVSDMPITGTDRSLLRVIGREGQSRYQILYRIGTTGSLPREYAVRLINSDDSPSGDWSYRFGGDNINILTQEISKITDISLSLSALRTRLSSTLLARWSVVSFSRSGRRIITSRSIPLPRALLVFVEVFHRQSSSSPVEKVMFGINTRVTVTNTTVGDYALSIDSGRVLTISHDNRSNWGNEVLRVYYR